MTIPSRNILTPPGPLTRSGETYYPQCHYGTSSRVHTMYDWRNHGHGMPCHKDGKPTEQENRGLRREMFYVKMVLLAAVEILHQILHQPKMIKRQKTTYVLHKTATVLTAFIEVLERRKTLVTIERIGQVGWATRFLQDGLPFDPEL